MKNHIMKLSGFDINDVVDDNDHDSPLPKIINLREVSIVATPKTLRALAKYLKNAANVMEKDEHNFGHWHFNEYSNGDPDIIVASKLECDELTKHRDLERKK